MGGLQGEINARIVAKIRGLLARRDGDAVDDELDALAYAQAEAVQLPMSLAEVPPRASALCRRTAFIDGFSLHADTSVSLHSFAPQNADLPISDHPLAPPPARGGVKLSVITVAVRSSTNRQI